MLHLIVYQIKQLAIETHTPEMDIHEKPEHRCTWSTRDTLAAMTRILIDMRNAGLGLYYT